MKMLDDDDGVRRRRRKSRELLPTHYNNNIDGGDPPFHKWYTRLNRAAWIYLALLLLSVLYRLPVYQCDASGSSSVTNGAILGSYENFAALRWPLKIGVVTVGLPLYGVIEVVPRETTHLVCYMGECLASALATIGRFILQWFIVPVMNMLECLAAGGRRLCAWLDRTVRAILREFVDHWLVPLCLALYRAMERVLPVIWEWILEPIWRTLYRIVDALILQPIIELYHLFVAVYRFVVHRILQPIWCIVTDLVQRVWTLCQTIVTRLLEYAIVKPLTLLYEWIALPLWHHVLLPLGEWLSRVLCELGRVFYAPVRAVVLRVVWLLYDIVWSYTLRPLLNLLYNVAEWLWQTLVPPILSLWHHMATLARALVSATTGAVNALIDAINGALLYFSRSS